MAAFDLPGKYKLPGAYDLPGAYTLPGDKKKAKLEQKTEAKAAKLGDAGTGKRFRLDPQYVEDADTIFANPHTGDKDLRFTARNPEGKTLDSYEVRHDDDWLNEQDPETGRFYNQEKMAKQRKALAKLLGRDEEDITNDMVFDKGEADRENFLRLLEEGSPKAEFEKQGYAGPSQSPEVQIDFTGELGHYGRPLVNVTNPYTGKDLVDAQNTAELNADYDSFWNAQKRVEDQEQKDREAQQRKDRGVWATDDELDTFVGQAKNVAARVFSRGVTSPVAATVASGPEIIKDALRAVADTRNNVAEHLPSDLEHYESIKQKQQNIANADWMKNSSNAKIKAQYNKVLEDNKLTWLEKEASSGIMNKLLDWADRGVETVSKPLREQADLQANRIINDSRAKEVAKEYEHVYKYDVKPEWEDFKKSIDKGDYVDAAGNVGSMLMTLGKTVGGTIIDDPMEAAGVMAESSGEMILLVKNFGFAAPVFIRDRMTQMQQEFEQEYGHPPTTKDMPRMLGMAIGSVFLDKMGAEVAIGAAARKIAKKLPKTKVTNNILTRSATRLGTASGGEAITEGTQSLLEQYGVHGDTAKVKGEQIFEGAVKGGAGAGVIRAGIDVPLIAGVGTAKAGKAAVKPTKAVGKNINKNIVKPVVKSAKSGYTSYKSKGRSASELLDKTNKETYDPKVGFSQAIQEYEKIPDRTGKKKYIDDVMQPARRELMVQMSEIAAKVTDGTATEEQKQEQERLSKLFVQTGQRIAALNEALDQQNPEIGNAPRNSVIKNEATPKEKATVVNEILETRGSQSFEKKFEPLRASSTADPAVKEVLKSSDTLVEATKNFVKEYGTLDEVSNEILGEGTNKENRLGAAAHMATIANAIHGGNAELAQKTLKRMQKFYDQRVKKMRIINEANDRYRKTNVEETVNTTGTTIWKTTPGGINKAKQMNAETELIGLKLELAKAAVASIKGPKTGQKQTSKETSTEKPTTTSKTPETPVETAKTAETAEKIARIQTLRKTTKKIGKRAQAFLDKNPTLENVSLDKLDKLITHLEANQKPKEPVKESVKEESQYEEEVPKEETSSAPEVAEVVENEFTLFDNVEIETEVLYENPDTGRTDLYAIPVNSGKVLRELQARIDALKDLLECLK